MSNSLQTLSAVMRYLTWISAFVLLTIFFNGWLKDQYNPNSTLAITHSHEPVILKRNRQGHYVATGFISGTAVTFLLDTGATEVSIPQHVATQLSLTAGGKRRVSTANGHIDVYRTVLPRVQLGNIELQNIAAHINPFMHDDTVLLGMSFLQHLDINQRNGVLELRMPM